MHSLTQQLISFCILFFIEIFFLRHITLWDIATPTVYIIFPLFLPFSISKTTEFLLGFAIALLIGIIIGPVGAGAFSLLIILSIRHFWASVISSAGSELSKPEFQPWRQNLRWIVTYLMPLLLVYECSFHILADFSFTWATFLKIITSTLYSSILCIAFSIILLKKTTEK